MKGLFTKKIRKGLGFIFVVLFLSGLVLSRFTTNLYVLIGIIAIQFIVFSIMLLFFFEKYVQPIEKASNTMDRLLEGNYKARIHTEMNGSIGELSGKINQLARNLSDLTTIENMQAEQLSTVIENSESGLVLIDEKGYIHVVNRKFLSIFGKTTQDYIGYLYYDRIETVWIHEIVQETFLHEKRVKKSFPYEKEGTQFYLEIVGAPIFNDRNVLRGMVLVVYDITELKRVEVMRKDFVANVSHELRTPITSIQGFAETLLDGAAEEEETRDYFLKIIFDESKRIQLLVEDLLVLSRLENVELVLNFTEIRVKDLLDDLLIVMNRRAEKKKIQITVDLASDVHFTADMEKIRQVLLNLLTNAINYTPENGQISLLVREEEEVIHFEIKDTGIGIAQELLPRLFERFYRIDKDRSRNTGGTGLGLAIVKHIVEAHKGWINVQSEVGVGTAFMVNIPKKN